MTKLSRRGLLTSLAAAPAVSSLVAPATAQPVSASDYVKAVLKDGKGTKLVLLGTAAGPVPGLHGR